MRIFLSLSFLLLVFIISYNLLWSNVLDEHQARKCSCTLLEGNLDQNAIYSTVSGALLASRFTSLQELKAVVEINYFEDPSNSKHSSTEYSRVILKHCTNGREVTSVLESGVSQGDIMAARYSSFFERVGLAISAPFAVANRADLLKIYFLARRYADLFGAGDVAFYDLAETSAKNIITEDLAYLHPRDSSEKGYINSFNHITAQAMITSCFSEDMADFLADVHERQSMPELTSGKFREDQLAHPDKNPVDNYVDMVNNEWGQELGKKLAKKFNINQETHWTPNLLVNYLNELQSYYSWAFQIGMKPYRVENELVIKFANKINMVMQDKRI
jgi:hypothetical protein